MGEKWKIILGIPLDTPLMNLLLLGLLLLLLLLLLWLDPRLMASLSYSIFSFFPFLDSMFFWLLSILTTAIWWIIIPPMQNIPAFIMPFSVVFQEAFRLLYYYMLKYGGLP